MDQSSKQFPQFPKDTSEILGLDIKMVPTIMSCFNFSSVKIKVWF
jgi:hypothetical protein